MKNMSSQETSPRPHEGMPKEALEGFKNAQDLMVQAQTERRRGRRESADTLEQQAEEISMKAHQTRKRAAAKKAQETAQYKTEIQKLREEQPTPATEPRGIVKPKRTYQRRQKVNKEINAVAPETEAVTLSEADEITPVDVIASKPLQESSRIETPEQEKQEIIEIGLSSPQELKEYLANVTDIMELLQNRETREEAIKDIQIMREKALQEQHIDQVKKFEALLREQREALDVVDARIEAVKGTESTPAAHSWTNLFKKYFSRGKGNKAA